MEQAIVTLKQVFSSTGMVIHFHKILGESETQAKQLQFVSSPTIRVKGQDVSLETTESHCRDCSEISRSESGTAGLTWSYQEKSPTEAPVGMIVEALLQAVYQKNETPIPLISHPIEVPQNRQQFFQEPAKKKVSCGTQAITSQGCGCSSH